MQGTPPAVKDIIGAWSLVSSRMKNPGDSDFKDWGHNLRGFLIYSPDGYMSANLVRNAGIAFDPVADVISYAGRFEIRGSTVHHLVEVAGNPTRIGEDLERKAQLNGNLLVLSGFSKQGMEFQITWQKAIARTQRL